MTLAGDSLVRFSESEQQELEDYRPLSRVALVSFLVGWTSALALAHLVFCIFPVAGVVLALMAMWQLRSPENKQSGRMLAVFGLGLSLLFASWAIAREASRDLHLYGQARVFAANWFELLRQGKVQEAHQLVMSEQGRAAQGVPLGEHYAVSVEPKNKKAASDMQQMEQMMIKPHAEFAAFYSQPVPQRLRELGKKARYEFLENVQIQDTGPETVEVELAFMVTGDNAEFPVYITLVRNNIPGVAADWRVRQVVDPHSH